MQRNGPPPPPPAAFYSGNKPYHYQAISSRPPPTHQQQEKLEEANLLLTYPREWLVACLDHCPPSPRHHPDMTPDMFVNAVGRVAARTLTGLTRDEREKNEALFDTWINECDKVAVMELYKDSGWRATYTKKLFLSRMCSMGIGFEHLEQVLHVKPFLMRTHTIVSLGCGPGPCIASTILTYRELLGCRQPLTITGVDRIGAWKEYVEELNNIDAGTAVRFMSMEMNEQTVSSLPAADLAVLSYTDASLHTAFFWTQLRSRYSLILILDQNKDSLRQRLMGQGFTYFEREFNGLKRFYFSVSPPPLFTQPEMKSSAFTHIYAQ